MIRSAKKTVSTSAHGAAPGPDIQLKSTPKVLHCPRLSFFIAITSQFHIHPTSREPVFAVAADEVRNLSQRTTEFINQICDTIEKLFARSEGVNRSIGSSQEKAREASQILNDTNKAIQRIVSVMNIVSLMNEQIATAAEEQASASSQINQNIHHVSDQSQEALNGSQSMEPIARKPVDVVDRVDALVSP